MSTVLRILALKLLNQQYFKQKTSNKYLTHLLRPFFYLYWPKKCLGTVPSRRIAMESKAMSINAKQNSIKMMQISMQYTYMYIYTNYRLQKHKGKLFIYPKAMLKIHNDYSDISARLYSSRPQPFWCLPTKRNTTHAHTRAHTLALNRSAEHQKMRQKYEKLYPACFGEFEGHL